MWKCDGRAGAVLRFAPVMIPYVAVGIGLGVFRSAWIVAAIYYGAVVMCLWGYGRSGLLLSLTRGWSWKGVLIAVAAAGGILGSIVAFWSASVKPDTDLMGILGRYGLEGTGLVCFVGISLVLNPVMEEVLWRGLLDVRSRRPGLIDAAFAGYHVPVLLLVVQWPFVVMGFGGLVVGSWALRWSRDRFGGLAIPWVGHLLADAAIVTGLMFFVWNGRG